MMKSKEWLTTSESLDFIRLHCPNLLKNYFDKFHTHNYSLLLRIRNDNLFGVETKKGYTHGRVEAVFFNKQSLKRADDMFYYRENARQVRAANNQISSLEDEIDYVAQELQLMQEKLDSLISLSKSKIPSYKKELASAKRTFKKKCSNFSEEYIEELEQMTKTTIHQKLYGVRI